MDFHQEAVHRHHPLDRWRRHAGLALPDGGHGNPERRHAGGARVADGGLRERGQGGRSPAPPADHPDAAGADQPEELGQAVPVALQRATSIFLLQHAPAGRPEKARPSHDDPRQKFHAVRLRAFGNYAFRMADPEAFHTEISGTRESYTVPPTWTASCAAWCCSISGCAIASSGSPVPRPGRQPDRLCQRRCARTAPGLCQIGPASSKP